MKIAKKRTTKWTLREIPNVNSPVRKSFITKLTEIDDYKKKLENGIPGFTSEELMKIEEKYKGKGGMQNKDIQNELKKKGLPVKQNTIKHYIKVNQLPKPIKHKKTGAGPKVAVYPINFMRHLNFVRFMLTIGREHCENILKAFNAPPASPKMSDYSFLQSIYYDEEIYDGDDRFEPFLYYTLGDMCNNLGLLIEIIKEGFNWHIKMIDLAEAVISNDININNNSFVQHQIKIFNAMKAKLEFSRNLDNEFARTRLKNYKEQLRKIYATLKDVPRKLDSLIEETRNASWT